MGTTSNDALRLPASLKTAAEEVAREDGATLNQFIVTAIVGTKEPHGPGHS